MKHISLFDIKVKSQNKNTILIKGNEFEVEHVPFEGSVKLSLNEDIHIKKITLSLIGEFYYEFSHKVTHEQYLDRLCVLKIDWNNLLCSDQGSISFGNYGDTTIPMYKVKKLSMSGASTPTNERPQNSRTKSTPLFKEKESSKILIPKSGIDGTPFKNLDASNHSFLLPKGNYSLPFKVYLPANIGETIEGLPIGTLLYKLQCNLERGRFEKKSAISKHIRIVRSLHPQNLNLCDSIDVENTWIGKLQYKVSMSRKGVAVGSTIPINVIIIPIAKGLSLKAMNACIVEHYHIDANNDKSPEYERLIGKQDLSIPDEDFPYDRWEIKTHFKVPDHLKQITQTCDVKSGMIVVKHRLRVAIQLRNKEGHVSELRANLPICVYISATSGHVIGRHYEVDNHHGTFVLDYKKEDLVFKGQDDDENEENDLDRSESAPPVYSKHVFDKIFDMNLPQTPLEQFRSQVGSPLHSNNNSSLNVAGYFDLPIEKAIEENMKRHKGKSPMSSVDYLHIPSYNEALDADDDEESFAQDDFAPSYSGSDSSSLNSTTPVRIKIPKNSSTSHFKFHLKSASLPHSRSSSIVNLDRFGETPSPKPKKFFQKK